MAKFNISPTTKFVHDFIQTLEIMTRKGVSNEQLGYDIRTYLAEYEHPELAVYWWDDILPVPPKLEDGYYRKAIKLAFRRITNEKLGIEIRRITSEFLTKKGRTLLWSKFTLGVV